MLRRPFAPLAFVVPLAVAVAVAFALSCAGAQARPAAPAPRPTLVVFITIDQMRGDYFRRFGSQFTGGLRRLEGAGAYFTNAFQDHAITETAPGHAAMLSGRFPVHTGIAMNDVGVDDSRYPLISGSEHGASPMRFVGSTLVDWMKAVDAQMRFLSVSRKDRGAILPIGRSKGDVYWYSPSAGTFTTSTYYATKLPPWVEQFNRARHAMDYRGWIWNPLLPKRAYPEPDSVPVENLGRDYVFPHAIPADPASAAAFLPNYPPMDELTLRFALEGLKNMQLGANPGRTDLLAVSLSTSDAVGHGYGPDSKELHDEMLRIDRYLGVFFDSLFAVRDSALVLMVLTSDHGISPSPEVRSTVTPNPGAKRVTVEPVWQETARRLAAAGVDTTSVIWANDLLVIGDSSTFVKNRVSLDSVVRAFANAARRVSGVARADLLSDLARADTVRDAIARRWLHMFEPGGPVKVVITLDRYNYWKFDVPVFATHGSPYDQDAWVPVVFWGPWFSRGRYGEFVRVVDIAPTLAAVLGVRPLEALDGRPLRTAIR